MIKRVYKDVEAEQRHTLYVFGSLEVRRTSFAGDAYTVSNESLVPYAMANGVRLARLHYSDASALPQVAGTGLGEQAYRTNTAATLHVLLELGDHLGSTGTVLDKLTSELVEKTTYLPFGARENDYRGTDGAGGSNRWSSFREDYGFTGKEEDVEVGLTYFGKRFLSPQLGRWVTADPLAVHAPGEADLNLYAYVHGSILIAVDPDGLEEVIRQLTKARAVEIAREAGVTKGYAKGSLAEERKVGRWVQQSALKTIDVKENGTRFMSEARLEATKGARLYVQPDGVADQKVWRSEASLEQGLRNIAGLLFGVGANEVRKNSTFYEVKTLKEGSAIHLPDSQHQISGLIDAASRQEAGNAKSGLPPVLRIITTQGVTIGADVVDRATKQKVMLVHHVMEEVYDTDTHSSQVRIGAGQVMNESVLEGRNSAAPRGGATDVGDWNTQAPSSEALIDQREDD